MHPYIYHIRIYITFRPGVSPDIVCTGIRIYGVPVHVRYVPRPDLEVVALADEVWPREAGAGSGSDDDAEEVDGDGAGGGGLDPVAAWSADLARLRQSPHCTISMADQICAMNRKHFSAHLDGGDGEGLSLPRDCTEVRLPVYDIHISIYPHNIPFSVHLQAMKLAGLAPGDGNALVYHKVGVCLGKDRKGCHLFFDAGALTKDRNCPNCGLFRYTEGNAAAPDSEDESFDLVEDKDQRKARRRRRRDRDVVWYYYDLTTLCDIRIIMYIPYIRICIYHIRIHIYIPCAQVVASPTATCEDVGQRQDGKGNAVPN